MGDVKRYFGNLATGPDTSTTCYWVSAEDYEALRARLAEETAIVDRIWDIFGRPSYESLNGKSLYDLIIGVIEERDLARQELAEVETVLNAWHEAFGTTQLTHAKTRLETAEGQVEALRARLGEVEAERDMWEQDALQKLNDYKCAMIDLEQAREELAEANKKLEEHRNYGVSNEF